MAKKIRIRVHNQNTVEETADAVLKVCIEASIVKFERILALYAENKRNIK